jgi:hypothetical protein
MSDDLDVKESLVAIREELASTKRGLRDQEVGLKRLKVELTLILTGLVVWYFFL